MQIFALFALLPLLANAAPLNLGGILAPPTTTGGTGTGIDIGAALGAGVVIGNPIPTLTGALAPKVTDLTETVHDVVKDVVQPVLDTASTVLSSLPSKVSEVVEAKESIVSEVVEDVKTAVQPVVDTASTVLSSLPSKVSEVVEAKESIVSEVVEDVKTAVQPVVDTASTVLSSLPSKVSEVVEAKESIIAVVPSVVAVVPEVIKDILPTGQAPTVALPTVTLPSVSIPSPSAILGSPSAALDALSAYLAGLKAPSVVVALVQLGNIINRLQQAVNGQAAALRNRVDLAAIVAYTHAVVRNISNYLNSIPNNVITNFAIKQLARSIDNLLASYIFGLQVIGLSTAAFAQQVIQLGLDAKGFSPLLPNTRALFP